MTATSENVQIRKDSPSGTILINRPEKRNALSREIVSMLDQSLQDFHQERNVRGVILTGVGDVFCAGTDLTQLQQTSDDQDAMKTWHQDVSDFRSLVEQMLRYPKPIVCAANGPVVGSGLTLLLSSDLVVASESATISLPESLRGLSPGLTMPLLSFRLGVGPAAKVLLSGETIDAQTAKELGLVHEVVSDELVWARSQELVKRIANAARESHQMTKQFLAETVGEALFTQLSIAAANMAAARTTLAAKEGVAAFIEKRNPDWDAITAVH